MHARGGTSSCAVRSLRRVTVPRANYGSAMASTASPATEAWAIAEAASRLLLETGFVRATSVLGSVARGNARPESDLDLLVITREPVPASRLPAVLPRGLPPGSVSLIVRDEARWLRAVERGSLFVLHARLEGAVVLDPDRWLEATLGRAARVPPDVAGELRRQRRRLRVLEDLSRFNGRFLFVLRDLFSVGKASAIAHCVAFNEPIFVKRRALKRLSELRPDVAPDCQLISELEPFYNVVRGAEEALPFPHDGDEARVRTALEAAKRLARG